MSTSLSASEEAQLLSSIEMFEVITQTDPRDYQSLEILKEAYSKLGREADVLSASKRIARAYVESGQLSSAILEYESILQRHPGDPEVIAALAEIESRANSLSGAPTGVEAELAVKPEEPAPPTKAAPSPGKRQAAVKPEIDDGRQQMQKIFVEGKLVSADDFKNSWPAHPDYDEPPVTATEPFLSIIAGKSLCTVETALKVLCEKSRLCYLPLDRYDIDIELARRCSAEICRRWCVLPIDTLSKSVLVVTCNPYNRTAAREIEESLGTRVIWYICNPADLMKSIKKVFR
ncbi:MAG TPA: tetratricopeptide repeat protein [Verrucomicrobiae bacterium]|nr:tetratricopeptide repeat protein [Verrucomicrobiae bacterium]